ncbi:MAG: SMC-Scp complex subunit ScpB [Candidatus Thermoplasmatota archaeon]|nr:SMC-Scp complex subunit ScpB [Candidatus Thermoplasmatota archaeon]
MKELERIVEAILFSAGRAVSMRELKELTNCDENAITSALEKLSLEYAQSQRAIEISKAGEKYAMQVKLEFADEVAKIAPKEIPEHLLKTLALIAYHQPVKQVELARLIGSKVYEHVKELEELGMIRARSEGRTKILNTSKLFPEYFGIGSTKKEDIIKWFESKVKANV